MNWEYMFLFIVLSSALLMVYIVKKIGDKARQRTITVLSETLNDLKKDLSE